MAERHYADHITTETGEEVRIEIHDSSFGGSATKLQGTGSGWASRSVQKLDVREPLSNPIQKSEVSATLWLTSSSLIDDLFSSEEGRFTLIYKKESTEYFEGEILPDLCDYEYLEDSSLWKLTVKAKDLSGLEGEDYTLATGRVTIIEAIADILPFSKTIKTHTSWIVEGETAANDYLRQVYLDKFALRTYARTGDESDEPITKLEALEWILKSNGLILKQENGWVLDHITAMDNPASVLESNYDSAGAFVSASNVDLTSTATITLQSKYNHNPGIKSARLKYDHRTKVSGITFPTGIELDSSVTTSESFSQLIISDGTQRLEFDIACLAESGDGVTESNGRYRIAIDNGSTIYYWDEDNYEWTTSATTNTFDLVNTTSKPGLKLWQGNTSIFTDELPADADGTLTITIYNASNADESIYGASFNLNFAIADENSIYIDYQLTQSGDQSVRVDYGSVYFGDGPTGSSRGAITTNSAGTAFTVEDWARRGEVTFVNHAQILLREVLDVQRKSRKRISATVKSALSFGDIVAYDSTNYYVLGGTYDGYTGVSSVELLEINIVTGSDTFEDLPKFEDEGSSGTSSTPSGGSVPSGTYFQVANNLSEGTPATMLTNLGLTATAAEINTLEDISIGNNNAILFTDGTGDIVNDADFTFDGTNVTLSGGSLILPTAGTGIKDGSDKYRFRYGSAYTNLYVPNSGGYVEIFDSFASTSIARFNQGGQVTFAGNVDANSLDIGGVEVIDSARDATFNSLAIDATGHGFDSSGNASAGVLALGGRTSPTATLDVLGTGKFSGLLEARGGGYEGFVRDRVGSTNDVVIGYKNSVSTGYFGMSGDGNYLGFVGSISALSNSNIKIYKSGALTGTSATLSGTLDVGGLASFSGDIELTAGDIGTDNFSAGWAGTGWQTDYAGDSEVQSLRVRGALRIYEFVAKQLSSVGGTEILSIANGRVESVNAGSNEITLDVVQGSARTSFKANDLFIIQVVDINNDLESGGTGSIVYRVFGTVTSVSGATITVSLDVSSDPLTELNQGDLVVAYGSTSDADRQAIMYRNVDRSEDNLIMRLQTGVDAFAGLAAVGNTRVAYGDLNGYSGLGVETFGFFAGDNANDHVLITDSGIFFKDGTDTAAQLSSSLFKIGDATNYLSYNTSTSAFDLQADTFLLETTNLSIDSVNELITVGATTRANLGYLQTQTINTIPISSEGDFFGLLLDSNNYFGYSDGDFVGNTFRVGDASEYLGFNNGVYIKASTFDLEAGALVIDSANTTYPTYNQTDNVSDASFDFEGAVATSTGVDALVSQLVRFSFDYDFDFAASESLSVQVRIQGYDSGTTTWFDINPDDDYIRYSDFSYLNQTTGTLEVNQTGSVGTTTTFLEITGTGSSFDGEYYFYIEVTENFPYDQLRLLFNETTSASFTTCNASNVEGRAFTPVVELNSGGLFIRESDAIVNKNGVRSLDRSLLL